MGLRIRTNVVSMTAQRQFSETNFRLNRSFERLSSGSRINRAADDAAGMGISESLRADIRSLNQARRNASDGIALIQVAEGSLEETTNILIRLKELAVQAASDNISVREREYTNLEFMALKDEIERIAYTTEFNGQRLLVGSTELPQVLDRYNQGPPLEVQVDKDYFPELDSLEQPNPVNIIRLNFRDINALIEGEGSLDLGNPQNEAGAAVSTKVSAQLSISRVEAALQKVSGYRARLGAVQNRLESTTRHLAIRSESLSAARSRIYDVDFASETANSTQFSILAQAGAAVLSQANQLPQVALQLLQ